MKSDILTGLPQTPMTPEREATLIAAGNKEDLVLGFMKEAFLYARRCCREKLPHDEVYSLCYKALAHAAKNFKSRSENPRFFGYAKIYIRGEIAREWKRKDVVRNSSSHAETLQSEMEPRDDDAHDPETNFHKPKVQQSRTPETLPEWEGLFSKDLIGALEPIIKSKLTNQEQTVLAMHYSQELSFSEIGRLLGVSRAASQSTHVSAIRKLRCALTLKERLLEK
jgi:RNA polymerase sigma factor (sigma-70 family)